MPRPKVAMRRIKEVLRLKEGLGLSDTAVSRSVRIARSTVKEYDRAAAVGLNWDSRPLTRAIGIVRCRIGRRSRRSCVAAA